LRVSSYTKVVRPFDGAFYTHFDSAYVVFSGIMNAGGIENNLEKTPSYIS